MEALLQSKRWGWVISIEQNLRSASEARAGAQVGNGCVPVSEQRFGREPY